jgi:transposase-like protein
MGGRRSASLMAGVAELRGRRQWTEADARRVLDAWEASGESITAFARGAGLVPQRLCWWRERLTRGGGIVVDAGRQKAVASAPAFLPVSVRPTTAGGAVVCVSSEGLRIEVGELDAASAAWVGAVVSSMKEVRS